MKKLVAFAMILSLGMFCAMGCNKADTGKKEPGKGAAAGTDSKAKADAGKADAGKADGEKKDK